MIIAATFITFASCKWLHNSHTNGFSIVGKWKIDYLSHQSSYSTINLNYYQFLNGINPYNNHPTFLTKVAEAFTNGFSIIGNLSIFMVSIWPVLVIIGLVIVLYKRRKWQTRETV